MFAIIRCRRLVRVSAIHAIFAAPQFLAHFSSRKSSSDVSSDGDGDAAFTISYLTNSWGLSSSDASDVSEKLCIKSRENADAVLELFHKYGFTDAQISRFVTRWPGVLRSRADKTLAPKIEFLLNIGVPPAVLPQKLSENPFLLRRSYENYFLPWYDYLKSIVQSDKNVVAVFLGNPMTFSSGWPKRTPSNIAILRERGIAESSIASLMLNKPSIMILRNDKLSACLDRVAEMGFRGSKMIVRALQMLGRMSESTLKQKMDTYRRCGWSEYDLTTAFSKYPLCMKPSQEKIKANMDFLVNEMGLTPGDIARYPVALDYSLNKRMRPRWMVIKVLRSRGLMKKPVSINSLFPMSESNFLKRYIDEYKEEIPELLDVYRGKISPSGIGLNRDSTSKWS